MLYNFISKIILPKAQIKKNSFFYCIIIIGEHIKKSIYTSLPVTSFLFLYYSINIKLLFLYIFNKIDKTNYFKMFKMDNYCFIFKSLINE